MGMNKSEKNDKREMTGGSDRHRSEGQGGNREGLSTKEGRSKDNDLRNTNRQRGRVRAMSVLGNAKSKSHRKTYPVESDGNGTNLSYLSGSKSKSKSGSILRNFLIFS